MAQQNTIRTVLAAVADTEAGGQVAARKAVEIAALFGAADVVLYHACYDPLVTGSAFFDTPARAKARRDFTASTVSRLKKVAAAVARPDVPVRILVEWQRVPHQAVARAALRERADIVVAEPRYRASRRRFGLSHTDWELTRICPVPLLLCRSAAPYSGTRVLAAVDPGGHGLRPSTLDVNIVNLAALVAAMTSGSVKVVHCLREPLLATRPAVLRAELLRVRNLLRHLAAGAGLSSRAARVVYGEPAAALAELIGADAVDLVVMGTVVRGPVRDRLIGSTAERLMHEVPCDMLLVKPNGFRTPLGPPSRQPTTARASVTAPPG
jgi:universal stress protein E